MSLMCDSFWDIFLWVNIQHSINVFDIWYVRLHICACVGHIMHDDGGLFDSWSVSRWIETRTHVCDVPDRIKPRYWYLSNLLSVRLLSVLRGPSGFSSPPQRPMTSDFEGFLYQILSITLFSYLNSWERASIFPFQCWVSNKGTTGTIFITSLVWRGLWPWIEPGTSSTRSQHSATRLSRRWLIFQWHILHIDSR